MAALARRAGFTSDALLAAAERASLTPKSRVAVVLHLSRLAPPAPRDYHHRIARAILQQSARDYDGEAFELESGDLALLCRVVAGGDPTVHPCSLPHVFQRLFLLDAPPDQALTTLWWLERQSSDLIRYANAQAARC